MKQQKSYWVKSIEAYLIPTLNGENEKENATQSKAVATKVYGHTGHPLGRMKMSSLVDRRGFQESFEYQA